MLTQFPYTIVYNYLTLHLQRTYAFILNFDLKKKSSFREFLDRHLKENRTKYNSSFREVRHLRGRHLRGFTV